jgi:hypothetical protein
MTPKNDDDTHRGGVAPVFFSVAVGFVDFFFWLGVLDVSMTPNRVSVLFFHCEQIQNATERQ